VPTVGLRCDRRLVRLATRVNRPRYPGDNIIIIMSYGDLELDSARDAQTMEAGQASASEMWSDRRVQPRSRVQH